MQLFPSSTSDFMAEQGNTITFERLNKKFIVWPLNTGIKIYLY